MSKGATAFAGQLYQLRSDAQLGQGAYVAVNGPWDAFGLVLKSTLLEPGGFLNLIRGIRPIRGQQPAAKF